MKSRHGRQCDCCNSRSRAAIENALAVGVPLRDIARKFGVSMYSAHRHRKNHLPAEAIAAILLGRDATEVDLPKLQALESERILAEIVAQRTRLREVRDMAVADGAHGLAIAAENSLRATLELECRLLGPILAPMFSAAAEPEVAIMRIENVIVRAADLPDYEPPIEREYRPPWSTVRPSEPR